MRRDSIIDMVFPEPNFIASVHWTNHLGISISRFSDTENPHITKRSVGRWRVARFDVINFCL